MWNAHKSIFLGLNQNFKLVCMLQSLIQIGSCCIGAFGHGQRKGHYFWKSQTMRRIEITLNLNFIFVCLAEMGVICNFKARTMTRFLQRAHGWCWCSQRHWEPANYRSTIHNQGPSQGPTCHFVTLQPHICCWICRWPHWFSAACIVLLCWDLEFNVCGPIVGTSNSTQQC